jgi:SAM-dependent methyltransferase
MTEDLFSGLDYYFLRHIDVQPETQKLSQSLYLPFYEGCHKVADLGCGDGDFVELLVEQGKEAIGVDSDPKACEMARERGIPIVCQDVFDYLENLPEGELDGIFSAHLVEHLAYQEVLRLFQLSYRALRPGGVIVATTPDVRGLYAHLEMFWLHFGHVSFYHPRLLCFFLEHVGFVATELGENPHTASPLMAELRARFAAPRSRPSWQPPPWQPLSSPWQAPEKRLSIPIGYEQELPLQGSSWWRRLSRTVKMFVARMVVWPYMEQLLSRMNTVLGETQALCLTVAGESQAATYELREELQAVAGQLQSAVDELQSDAGSMAATLFRLDNPFECYVIAKKPTEIIENKEVEPHAAHAAYDQRDRIELQRPAPSE